jgi:hypothetical protein
MSRDEDDKFFSLMEKIGQDDSPGDTGESTVGVQPDAYPDPSDEGQTGEGTVDASWGQTDIKPGDPAQTAQHHSNAVLDEFRRGREEFLQRHFDAYGSSSKTNQKVMAQALSHGSGDHESSTAMMDAGSKRSPAAVETVVDKTKRVLDAH